ncbi:mucin-4 [Hyla sarda]|uniref:mucin-4 n=1 Tax=Hyla sarda TaxID=327740 RepID=UPI0024C3DEED|nr:mucin-4 [Hyla sarda]
MSTATPGTSSTISTISPTLATNQTVITAPVTNTSTITSTTTTTRPTSTSTIPSSTSVTSALPTSTTASGIPTISLFPYGANETDMTHNPRSTDFTSPVFQPIMGFPFGNSLRNFVYYTDNGQIVFPRSRNEIFSYTNPPTNGFSGNEMVASLAVYWSDADLSKGVGTTYYKVYEPQISNSVVPEVEKIISKKFNNSYKAQWTLKITWDNVPAYPSKQNDIQTNTYQAVLTTNGIQSYLMILFKDGGMNWADIERKPKPLIGYCSGNQDTFFLNDKLAVNINRPNLVVGNNADVRGLWIYELNNGQVSNSRMDCLSWFYDQPNPVSWNFDLLSCPCLYQQGQADSRFRATQAGGSTYVSLLRSTSPSRLNAGVRCVYYRRNQFLEGFQEQTWYFSNSNNDKELNAFNWCCNDVDDPKFCSMYMEKRPSIDCRNYRPPTPGWMFGDPHITTLDGFGYTFNGLGDFILLKAAASNISLVLHGRTAQTGTASATNFQAFAVQYISSSVNVKVEWYLESSNYTTALLDGKDAVFTFSSDMNANISNTNPAVLLKKDSSVITATFESFVSVEVSAQLGMLTAVTNLPSDFLNNTKGLLGTWNNNQNDDLFFDNGTTIPINSSEEQIFYYGMEWEVKGEILFTKPKAEGISTFKPVFLSDLKNQFPEKYNELQQICGDKPECIFDALSTNQTELGLATREVSIQLTETNIILNAIPPFITGNSIIKAFLKRTVTVQYTANGTGVVFSADRTHLDITLTVNGTLTWSPKSMEGFTFNLIANDSQKLSSTLQPSFVVCGCNQESECDYSTLSKVNGTSLSISNCNCTNNYTGDFCQNPPNLCIQGCFPGVSCDNTTGCDKCPPGYTGNGAHCSDINECEDNNSCPFNSTCINAPGSFSCDCNSGFTWNGSLCEDNDECTTNNNCSPNATCTNTIGSYTCKCKEGFTGNGSHCEDIDECANLNTCSPYATCTNNIGNYICKCKEGFTGNGSHCEDINECTTNSNNCSPNATCTNAIGNYTCNCKEGFAGNGSHCEDVNECTTNSSICTPNATCTNTIGSYTCKCKEGFTGNGSHCEDFDECMTNSNNCSPNATCTNTIGNYTCKCNEGFAGNGIYCSCTKQCETGYCRNGGTCQTVGLQCTPQCTCPSAFSGEICTDPVDSFMPTLDPNTKQRSVIVNLTSMNNFSETNGYELIKGKLLAARYNVTWLFDQAKSEMNKPNNVSGNFLASYTARFTYVANITIVKFLNDELVAFLLTNTSGARSKRSSEPSISISSVADGEKLTPEELAKNASCGYAGYIMNDKILECVSKCVGSSYCKNGGICQLVNGNVSCSCKPFSIYVTSGTQCENLAMNLNAFFGILFGALAFLLLLLLGIGFGVYWYRKRKENCGEADETYQTRFSWKTSLFSSFERLGETEIPSLEPDIKSPHLVNWKPHLEKVNSLVEVKIKRPEIKSDLVKIE